MAQRKGEGFTRLEQKAMGRMRFVNPYKYHDVGRMEFNTTPKLWNAIGEARYFHLVEQKLRRQYDMHVVEEYGWGAVGGQAIERGTVGVMPWRRTKAVTAYNFIVDGNAY